MTLSSDLVEESFGITAVRDTNERVLRCHCAARRRPPILDWLERRRRSRVRRYGN
jgi:hypothetical protein